MERIGIIGREKSENRLAELLHSTWSRLTCHVRGHLYRPMYVEGRKLVKRRGYAKYVKVVQYTCECCGEKTAWMGRGKHKEFELSACPTWGDRGSDSQNYRGKEVYDDIDLD